MRTNKSTRILIYGAGGFAREVAWLVRRSELGEVVAYVDDSPSASMLDNTPVIALSEAAQRFRGALLVSAIGSPASRERTIGNALRSGFGFATLYDASVIASESVEVGKGSIICAGSILTVNIRIGEHVHINLDCTIGHDSILEDYVTLAPGVHVSGWVHIERGAYIGTGANIINGTSDAPLIIGSGAVVGAGACVTRSISSGVTAVGIPAKPLAAPTGK